MGVASLLMAKYLPKHTSSKQSTLAGAMTSLVNKHGGGVNDLTP
jgi:hypothetical protein